MTLDDALSQDDPARLGSLPEGELARLFWRYKGLEKQFARERDFWSATNENLKLAYEELDEKDRELTKAYGTMREDLSLARQVQRALMSRPFPDMLADLEIAVHQEQLTEVGGDYYDFFRLPDGQYAAALYDISGHGVSAALIMSFLKSQFMRAAAQFRSPGPIVEWVNRTSYDFLREIRRYSTVHFVAFDPGRIRYVSGGGYGLLVRGGERYVLQRKAHFLGLRQCAYVEHELPFEPGDLLALYTDGIVEAQNAAGADYSVRRLNDLVARSADLSASDIVERCVADYRAFRADDSDDITLMILRRRPR
jgi:sigma-B regulation protein RsbU (phosphoserine phosphatase)